LPSTAHVLALAQRANINPSWLLLGEGPELRGTETRLPDVASAVRAAVRAHLVARGTDEALVDEFLGERATRRLGLLDGLFMLHEKLYLDWIQKKANELREKRTDADLRLIDELMGLLERQGETAEQSGSDVTVPAAPVRAAAAAAERLRELRSLSEDADGLQARRRRRSRPRR
jgi:hypothetical protein